MLPEVYHLPYPMPVSRRHARAFTAGARQLFQADVTRRAWRQSSSSRCWGKAGSTGPSEFLRRLGGLCDSHGIVLIRRRDPERIGRTGRMFAIEHAGVSGSDHHREERGRRGAAVASPARPTSWTRRARAGWAGPLPLTARHAPRARGTRGMREGAAHEARAGDRALHELAPEGLQCAFRVWATCARSRHGGHRAGEERRAEAPDAELTKALVQAAGRRGL